MNKTSSLLALVLGTALSILSVTVYADPPMAAFYESAAKINPNGKLGQIVKQEKITSSVKGAQAWRIAYISSDAAGRKTIATGTIIAPNGSIPKEGRPILAWVN